MLIIFAFFVTSQMLYNVLNVLNFLFFDHLLSLPVQLSSVSQRQCTILMYGFSLHCKTQAVLFSHGQKSLRAHKMCIKHTQLSFFSPDTAELLRRVVHVRAIDWDKQCEDDLCTCVTADNHEAAQQVGFQGMDNQVPSMHTAVCLFCVHNQCSLMDTWGLIVGPDRVSC